MRATMVCLAASAALVGASHIAAAQTSQSGAQVEQQRQVVKRGLKFAPLIGGVCWMAKLKMNVPDSYELFYKYNLTFGEAKRLSDAALRKCGLPGRPKYQFDVEGQPSHEYESWLRKLDVALHPTNNDAVYDPNYFVVKHGWRSPDYIDHFHKM